jgi:hypothetical protein
LIFITLNRSVKLLQIEIRVTFNLERYPVSSIACLVEAKCATVAIEIFLPEAADGHRVATLQLANAQFAVFGK